MKSLQPDWNNLAQQAEIPSIWDETKLNCPEFQKYFIPFSRNLNLVWNLHVWEGNEAEKTLQKNLTITTNKKIGVILWPQLNHQAFVFWFNRLKLKKKQALESLFRIQQKKSPNGELLWQLAQVK